MANSNKVDCDAARTHGRLMTESIRNVLEGLADSQMLSCDTRADIRRTREAVEKLVRLAERKRRKPPTKGKR